MLGMMLVKEVKQLLRERSELLTLLLMPVILITILGSALQGMTSPGAAGAGQLEAAVVIEEPLDVSLAQFQDLLEAEGMPPEMQETLLEEAAAVSVPEMFTEMLQSLEEDGVLEVSIIDDAADVPDDAAGVWEFDEGYRVDTWQQMFLQDEVPEPVIVRVDSQLGIIEGITGAFFEELNWQKEAAYLAMQEETPVPEAVQTEVETRQLDNRSVITSFDYYTAGMAVMFVLYTATFLASTAHTERRTYVFQRLLTSNVPLWLYVAGKGGAGVLLALVQLTVIFSFSSLVFGVSFQSLGLTAVIALGLALTVGSLAMLLTAVNYRLRNEQATALFASAGVTILAFLGGSFFNVSQLSETMAFIGRMLPNGAAMQSLLAVMGGAGAELIYPMFVSVFAFCILCIVAAMLVFPRKEDV
ncbi:ABC transporter permease [Alkalicoccus luteus]|uniref:ABC transporter permease n=1 Tax=Alkalicoccus luteus TaxID=1237094 RepID=A0A969TV25_9BACI|nr:ABC transporter permease [Alkalicoccus luteus]NJP37960.1 ABC transporter permease [Alkalicoccus luteus]